MTTEPSEKQCAVWQALGPRPLLLVQFLEVREQAAFQDYLAAGQDAVRAQGGQRVHSLRIDQVLAGGAMPYEAITVDAMPSGPAALAAFKAVGAQRQAAVLELYALAVRASARSPGVVRGLGFLAPLLRHLLGTGSEREMPGFAQKANPETGPVPRTVATLRGHDLTAPFFMMNLNKYYTIARYENGERVSGEVAYNRYSQSILPYLVSVGGYPAVLGRVQGILVVGARSPLDDDWDEFALVYYPSRQRFLNMMSHSPKKGIKHRSAGLARAVLMPSSDWEPWARP
jgi:hypothetical protein